MPHQRTACVLQSVSLQSPVGELQVTGCDKGVHAVDITMETAQRFCDDPSLGPADLKPEMQQCVKWLQSYFRSAESVSSIPFPALHHQLLQEDSFTACVLRTLQTSVPVGQTVSYKQLAEMVGNPKAVRAVGGAMRRNPVPLIVPCHRVVCSSGGSGRYMGGRGDHIKQWLLLHEKQDH